MSNVSEECVIYKDKDNDLQFFKDLGGDWTWVKDVNEASKVSRLAFASIRELLIRRRERTSDPKVCSVEVAKGMVDSLELNKNLVASEKAPERHVIYRVGAGGRKQFFQWEYGRQPSRNWTHDLWKATYYTALAAEVQMKELSNDIVKSYCTTFDDLVTEMLVDKPSYRICLTNKMGLLWLSDYNSNNITWTWHSALAKRFTNESGEQAVQDMIANGWDVSLKPIIAPVLTVEEPAETKEKADVRVYVTYFEDTWKTTLAIGSHLFTIAEVNNGNDSEAFCLHMRDALIQALAKVGVKAAPCAVLERYWLR